MVNKALRNPLLPPPLSSSPPLTMFDAQPIHDRKRKADTSPDADDDVSESLVTVDQTPPPSTRQRGRISTASVSPCSSRRAASNNVSRKRPRRLSAATCTSPLYDSPGVSPTRVGSDIEDFGWTLAQAQSAQPKADDVFITTPPIDVLRSALVPPLLPVVNRQTLRELDMDAMLRNSPLRKSQMN
jgi:hypothetical protein